MKEPKDFKIQLLYPNVMLQNTIPINLALISACLKEKGFSNIRLFDTTLYKTQEISGDEVRAKYLQLKKWNFDEVGVQLKRGDLFDDFENEIKEYDPDIIFLTMVEPTYHLTKELLERIRPYNKTVVVGGALATFAPDFVAGVEDIDIICVGEGERAAVELCQRMRKGEDYSDIPNLWVKTEDSIIKNEAEKQITDINELPFLDFSIFEEKRFYRPNRGKVFKTLPIETTRGCPFQCTFCCSPSWARKLGKGFYRQKSFERVMRELKYQKEELGMEFVYFSSESFLSMPAREFEQFMEGYKDIDLPLWFQTRPETIRYERLKLLKDNFDFRLSVGIESGSENLRRNVLNRQISNDKILENIQILNDLDITYGVNNIVGFPDETREDIFKTIELNRQAQIRDANVFIFTPFRGTRLHELCVEKGYIPKDHIATEHVFSSSLRMPQISSEEIYGLFRTFPLYVKLPKEYYPRIKEAEEGSERGDAIYEELAEIFRNEFQ